MSRQVLVLGVLSVLVAGGSCGSSCVDFDGQTVRAHVSPDKDRLDVLLLYRGLHSTGPDTTQAIEQLEAIRGGARWFALLSNFPFAFHIDELVGNARDSEQPAANRLLELLDENVQVRNGELWLDDEGRLNAWQLLRFSRLSAVLDAANAAQAEQARHALAREDREDLSPLDDEQSVALLAAAVGRGDTFWAFDGQALTLTLPASDAAWATIKRELDRVVFVLGSRRADELRLQVPAVGLQGAGLTDALHHRGWPIAARRGDEAAQRAYEAFLREN